ncbi:hypothetical protein D6T64_11820 [Cryobacterium melibiosiphilum]|uniref:Uncharacterized protein n=1 Tax=Cryobacterium melibiosiphilum TaxID=995039 RepID=A0A3A5MD71_9MICO|nr:hypothetical protein [Cryobacterium melibiosiphilum]RJT88070.1 hypothetical protein D6T64_11820 [Cryobacterium melibiosiphilum]
MTDPLHEARDQIETVKGMSDYITTADRLAIAQALATIAVAEAARDQVAATTGMAENVGRLGDLLAMIVSNEAVIRTESAS